MLTLAGFGKYWCVGQLCVDPYRAWLNYLTARVKFCSVLDEMCIDQLSDGFTTYSLIFLKLKSNSKIFIKTLINISIL